MDENTKNLIQEHIDNNDVCLFMKGTPDAPQCGFSMAVSNMLKILEVNFKGVNVLEDQSLREGIKTFSDWPTIPQLYVKKEFIGGCDIVKEMYENGELKKIFDEFNNLLDEKNGVIEVTITTIDSIEKALQSKIQSSLEKTLNCKIKLRKIIDKSIIGGIILKVNSIMIDNSIKNKLQDYNFNERLN